MRKSKEDKIQEWINTPKPVNYGNLALGDDKVYTYNVLLAKIERGLKRAIVNMERFSATSSTHRNALLGALRLEGYYVIEVDCEADVTTAFR